MRIGDIVAGVGGTVTIDIPEVAKFVFTDTVNSGGYDYFGFQKDDGEWQVKRLDDTSMRVAEVGNNPTMSTYTLAFSNYITLQYDKVEDI